MAQKSSLELQTKKKPDFEEGLNRIGVTVQRGPSNRITGFVDSKEKLGSIEANSVAEFIEYAEIAGNARRKGEPAPSVRVAIVGETDQAVREQFILPLVAHHMNGLDLSDTSSVEQVVVNRHKRDKKQQASDAALIAGRISAEINHAIVNKLNYNPNVRIEELSKLADLPEEDILFYVRENLKPRKPEDRERRNRIVAIKHQINEEVEGLEKGFRNLGKGIVNLVRKKIEGEPNVDIGVAFAAIKGIGGPIESQVGDEKTRRTIQVAVPTAKTLIIDALPHSEHHERLPDLMKRLPRLIQTDKNS